jgi:hypothetical protein
LGHDQVPEDDYEFWAVAFHDENDETMYRQDADSEEISNIKSDPEYCKVWRTFTTNKKPSYWVVWPYSTSKGWCEKLKGHL